MIRGSSPISVSFCAMTPAHRAYSLPGGFSVGIATNRRAKSIISDREASTASIRGGTGFSLCSTDCKIGVCRLDILHTPCGAPLVFPVMEFYTNCGAGFSACGLAFQGVQPAGRPACGHDWPPHNKCRMTVSEKTSGIRLESAADCKIGLLPSQFGDVVIQHKRHNGHQKNKPEFEHCFLHTQTQVAPHEHLN